jgi:tripartite-type tricarboxylate transporter receptor subunit TctC
MQLHRKLQQVAWLVLTIGISTLLFPHRAPAQQTGRMVTIIVPFAASGGTNVLARLLGEELQKRLGRTVVIDNKPGASGNIGAQMVARAAPDGATLLLTADPPFTANITLMRNVPYDPSRSFAPIIEVAVGTMALAAYSSVPATTTPAFIEYVKARPGQLNYGSAGVGTPHHLAMELFKLTAQVNLSHVPFRDTAGSISSLLGGHVAAAFLPLNVALPLPGDKVRLLGVAANERLPGAPNVPTFTEEGIPEIEAGIRFGLLAPIGTPEATLRQFNTIADDILRTPEFAAKLQVLGLVPSGGSAEQYGRAIARDSAKWQKVVSAAGIRAE